MKDTYRLPSGETTKSVEVYLAAWRELGRPISEITGYKLYAYDPDMSFQSPDFWDTFDIPVHVAIKLYPHIKDVKNEN